MERWNYNRVIVARMLSLLMILNLMLAGITAFNFESVYATAAGMDIKQGDVLDLKVGTWEEEYIVLDPVNTNTGSKGMFLL